MNYLEHLIIEILENTSVCIAIMIIFWSKNPNFLAQTCHCMLKVDKS